jgi:hypothetical protein
MDEGIVEGCENTCDSEDEFSWCGVSLVWFWGGEEVITISNLRAQGDVLLSGTGSFLWRHVDLWLLDWRGVVQCFKKFEVEFRISQKFFRVRANLF